MQSTPCICNSNSMEVNFQEEVFFSFANYFVPNITHRYSMY
jgi:hypothetical protein